MTGLGQMSQKPRPCGRHFCQIPLPVFRNQRLFRLDCIFYHLTGNQNPPVHPTGLHPTRHRPIEMKLRGHPPSIHTSTFLLLITFVVSGRTMVVETRNELKWAFAMAHSHYGLESASSFAPIRLGFTPYLHGRKWTVRLESNQQLSAP